MTKFRLALFVVPVLVMSVSAADISGIWGPQGGLDEHP